MRSAPSSGLHTGSANGNCGQFGESVHPGLELFPAQCPSVQSQVAGRIDQQQHMRADGQLHQGRMAWVVLLSQLPGQPGALLVEQIGHDGGNGLLVGSHVGQRLKFEMQQLGRGSGLFEHGW